ncbi:MAG: efflux RND transporter permease subunit [Cloacibacterium sp.]
MFLPLALAGGLIGSILKEFALVVVVSTLMSLFVSFTITPMLASRFGRLEHLTKDNWWGRINLKLEEFIDLIKDIYGKGLRVALNRKRWVLGFILLLLVGSIALVPTGFIGGAFIPAADKGEVVIDFELAPSSSVYQTNMIAQQAEEMLLKKPEVETVFSSIGFVPGSVAGSSNSNNLARLTVKLKPKRNISSENFGINVQKEISEKIPGVIVSAGATSISGNATNAPIQINVRGLDLVALRKTAEEIKAIAETVPGTQFVKLSVKDRKTEVAVEVNRDKLVQYGLDANQVGSALQKAFSGDDKGKFKQSGNEYDILISLDQANRSDVNNVKNLSFTNADGQSFVLSQFADVKMVLGETVLQRKDRLNSISINSNVAGRPVGTVSNEILEKIKKIKIPEGVILETGGDVKNQSDAFGSLGIALVTAIILVYLVMVALYESLVYPFVVLFSIPVALIGALLALALTMETLNIFSIIGMIMLLGLVSKNGILIVDFTNHLREQGSSVKDALVEAGMERLRPILMTTLAMILGMLPIALAAGEGSEIKNGMAWVIIGGLTSSMLLTLFIVPCMYYIIYRIQEKFASNEKEVIRFQK